VLIEDERRDPPRSRRAGARRPGTVPGSSGGQSLGDLAIEREILADETPCAAIDEWFRAGTARRSLVVAGPSRPVLVNRSAFYEALAGRLGYGWSLFHDAPLAKLLDRVAPGPVLPASTSLTEAGLTLLSGGQVDSDQDVMVVWRDGRVGTLAVAIVLAELVKVHSDQVAKLATSESRFRSLVQNSFDLLLLLDGRGMITDVGPSEERISGTRPDEVIGTSVLDRVHPEDRLALSGLLATSLASPGLDLGGQFRQRRASGGWGWFEMRVRNLLEDPAVSGVVVNYRDVTEAKQLEDRLRYAALHDSLTGLPNRAFIVERGAALLRKSRDRGVVPGLLFVDLDAFKDVNDTLGHSAGDELLRHVAARLASVLRASDLVGRLGGDEFVVVVEGGIGHRGPEAVARRILELFAAPFQLGNKEHTITASIGIALGAAGNIADLLQQSDIALYEAKQQGRNCAVVFAPEMQGRIENRLALESELSHAAGSGQFFLLYQPVFDLDSLKATGMEALLRWQHPEQGTIVPDVFIPVLESTGLIVEVGRFVLREACNQAAAWMRQGRRVDVSINLSACQLEKEDLVDDVAEALRASGADPSCIILEITESTLMQDVDATSERLAALRALGLRLAIDDFGTGYSSLSYLRGFAVDILKIDKSFVASLGDSPRSAALVRTLLQLGRDLGMETVAEGVEREEQLRLLREEGCNKVQGFLLGRPVLASEAASLLDIPPD
jgi:diguanylate cyclase (GGDEF)-like protein/PAS domain S-box-containing protein